MLNRALLKEEVFAEVNKFFQDGEWPKEINEIIIVRIPNIKQTEELKDFQPTVFPYAMPFSIKLWPNA